MRKRRDRWERGRGICIYVSPAEAGRMCYVSLLPSRTETAPPPSVTIRQGERDLTEGACNACTDTHRRARTRALTHIHTPRYIHICIHIYITHYVVAQMHTRTLKHNNKNNNGNSYSALPNNFFTA